MQWCWLYRRWIGQWNFGINNLNNLWLLNVHIHSWYLDIINVRWIHSWYLDMVNIRWIQFWDFNSANWTSVSIGKTQFLYLFAAKSVDLSDHCIRHWDKIPTAPNNFIFCVERHKFKAAMQVSTGPKLNGALFSRVLTIARSIFLVHLTVLSNLET